MLVLVGLDHRRATVDARGRLNFSGDSLISALQELSAEPDISEVALLSTCNRTEVYLAAADAEHAEAAARRFLDETATKALVSLRAAPHTTTRDAADLQRALYSYQGVEAVRHLYYVTAGLRSMVIGEPQILGQVREAYTLAEANHTCGEEMRAAFTGALQVGKRVRTETGIARNDSSVASIAIHAARAQIGSLAGKTVTLVGAGRTSELAASLLRDEQLGSLIVANRHEQSARALADRYDASAVLFDELPGAIGRSDLVISATAAPYAIIQADMVEPRQEMRPLLILDLSIPGDVAAGICAMPGVTVINLDDLHDMPGSALEEPGIAAALADRHADIDAAERLIEDSLREYTTTQTVRLVAPGIAALRRHVDASQEQELARALAQLSQLSDQERTVIERFGARLVDKMFHHLVRRIRTLAEYDEIPPEITMQVLVRLFSHSEEQ
ncbi:MAG TPA: glutamyl-tRNA reductase [Ktedonobacterales bacterium]